MKTGNERNFLWGGSRIFVRRSFDPRRDPEPKICLKLPENGMILKISWGASGGRAPNPLDPIVEKETKSWICSLVSWSQTGKIPKTAC